MSELVQEFLARETIKSDLKGKIINHVKEIGSWG